MHKPRSLPLMVACIALGATGCSPSAGTSRAVEAATVNHVSGYELPEAYSSALNHQGNDAIFTAVVRNLMPAKEFTPKGVGSASLTYVYTPVRAQITAVLKQGKAHLQPGRLVTLRILGGATATTRTINEVTAGPDHYQAGQAVQIFSQPPFTDPDTGEVQYVPNWSFAQSADHKSLTNLHEPSATIPLGTALAQAQQKADRSGWNK